MTRLRVVGGHRNEGDLTEEHMRLPEELRRRVSGKIVVVSVTEDEVVYRSLVSGWTHKFLLIDGVWRWRGGAP